jgi:hypothetical protein
MVEYQAAFERHSPSLERQYWLEQVVEALRSRFDEVGYSIPDNVRVSIGWPKRGSTCGVVGECWSTEASSDQHYEVFVSPELMDSMEIVSALAHELVHATVGTDAGHGVPFRQCAIQIGLTGPMKSTVLVAEFTEWAETLFKRIGPYPAGGLTAEGRKQTTSMLKCECSECGYVARVSRKWLDEAGPPICPTDEIPLMVMVPEEETEEEALG